MKLSTTILALAVGAVADLATIQGVLSGISTQVNSLDTAVNGFGGDASGLLSAGTTLLSTIKSGTDTIGALPVLASNEAVQVASYVSALNSSVATVVSDLISKKSAIVAAGYGSVILSSLQSQKLASADLATVLTDKVPTALQQVANSLSAGIQDSIAAGVAAYQGTGAFGSDNFHVLAGRAASLTGSYAYSSLPSSFASSSYSYASSIQTYATTTAPAQVTGGAGGRPNGVNGALAVAAFAVFAL